MKTFVADRKVPYDANNQSTSRAALPGGEVFYMFTRPQLHAVAKLSITSGRSGLGPKRPGVPLSVR